VNTGFSNGGKKFAKLEIFGAHSPLKIYLRRWLQHRFGSFDMIYLTAIG
jgi:hypothetical protein